MLHTHVRNDSAAWSVALIFSCALALLEHTAQHSRRVELAGLTSSTKDRSFRCDAKCESAWVQHVKAVQAKLAAEHKAPSASPTGRKFAAIRTGGQSLGGLKTPGLKAIQAQMRAQMHSHAHAYSLPAAALTARAARTPESANHPRPGFFDRQNAKRKHPARWKQVAAKAIPAHVHWAHNNNFWSQLGYSGERYVPWKESRQLQRKEREAAARRGRGRSGDHVLDYLQAPASVGNPVDSELAKLGIEGTHHSFASLRRPVDHTLDYLHADKGNEQAEAKIVAARSDHFKDFLSVPKDHRKVRLEAVDTFESIKHEARA